jgi:ParB family chromosome partitioning protein
VSKAGLPIGVKMRHDSHYVDQIAAKSRSVGRTIAITSIYPNSEQPRNEFGDLTELTESIREKGVLEPLLVKPMDDGQFMIIAGERRWRASQLAGLAEVPCIEMDIDAQGVAEIALIENLQRKDLTVWEEADGLKALSDKFGYKQDEIAQKISKSRTTVTEFMTIAGLPDDIRTRCRSANINSKATLLEIARQFDEAAMFEYLDNLISGAPTKKKQSGLANGKMAVAAKPALAPHAEFKFVGENDLYHLQVSFSKPNTLNRTNLLKALKEAFDAVKDGSADI